MLIHRHTGGLETAIRDQREGCEIHRHTGGLEIALVAHGLKLLIHRHTGGLEKQAANKRLF